MISKTRYVSGQQCPKRLWFEVNAREQVPAVDAATEAIFEQGHEVGRLAQRLFPGGVEVSRDERRWSVLAAATRRALAARIPLYEAAFEHSGGACRVDILAPVDGGEWDLFEVKSSTSVKDVHLVDLAFQTWVLRGAGVPVRRSHLVRIDTSYVRQGAIEIDRLFAIDDLTEEIEPSIPGVAAELARLRQVAGLPAAPEVPIGPHCTSPYDCPLRPLCWAGVPAPSVLDLVRGGGKAWDLFHSGFVTLGAIPPEVELTDRQRIQVEAARAGGARFDPAALAHFLGRLEHPVHSFDLESFQSALPPFDGTRPYQQIPFQYSLHVVEAPDAAPRAIEFLADEEGDPRPAFLASLRANVAERGSIVVFNASFERSRLEEVAAAFPEHGPWIDALLSRFVDLLEPFQRFDYYHPAQNGSASLKAVLPVLGARGYDHLEIQDGTAAAREFLRLRGGGIDPSVRASVREALLAYCGRDTEGMVEIVTALRRLVDSSA